MKKLIFIIAILLSTARMFAQSYQLGSTFEGGIIFYYDPSGAWGLVAAPNDLPPSSWDAALVACRQLTLGGKVNWHLPTIEELRILYDNRAFVGDFSVLAAYWSATEVSAGLALTKWLDQSHNGLEPGSTVKSAPRSVRAIRAFYIPLTGAPGEPACLPETGGAQYVPGPAFFNYGGGIDLKNNTRRMNVSIGEMVVGSARANDYTSGFGTSGQFLAPPFSPVVTATQGELLDRIQISWSPNPLGPLPSEGFELYRDGIFLGAFGPGIRNFNDFNVIAGRPYIYEVQGINVYGKGPSGSGLGFQVPNGVVTGFVETLSGTPVPDAQVTLMPMQGFSMQMGNSDLAFAQDTAGFLKNATQWTLSTWVQTDTSPVSTKIFKFEGEMAADTAKWWLSTLKSTATQEGVVLNVTGQPSLTIPFPDSTRKGWHHIAITQDGSQFRAYLDGVLTGSIMAAAVSGTATTLNIGGEGAKWQGRMDELRIYHQKLDELDFGEIMEGTASSLTPGLKYYWKMDEELGTKSFDIIGRNKLYFCGAAFDPSRPPVRTSGKTNAQGYYRIESANYGTGTTFLAEPSKLFYMHRALKFTRNQSDYVTLPNFGLTDSTELETATIECWVNSAGPDGTQCLLSKKWGSNEFRVTLTPSGNNNELKCNLNGSEQAFGNLGIGYQHLAFTFVQTGGTATVKAYKNGVLLPQTGVFGGQSGNWSDSSQVWCVGARLNGTPSDYFGGLIDEVAMYDTILPPASIQAHVTTSRDPQERHLRAYFAFDEGSGNKLSNTGSQLTGAGTAFGTDWSAFCPIQSTEPHIFSPNTRQVTLNPSVTSVDNVDFTDRSTIAVSGYVRYVNTDCFAKNVEILVNGVSYNPAVYTDSTGRFVLDLDPGATVTLAPKFEDHAFAPAFWDITNITNPIAGLVFNDMTTRSITGVVAGGNCLASIIPAGTLCKVKVRSLSGCYEKEMTVVDLDNFDFTGLPPIEMTVAVTQHSNPFIMNAFQIQGGKTVDLSKRDTAINFLYFSDPEVMITSGWDTLLPCTDKVVFASKQLVTLNIELVEHYTGGVCPVQTADFKIINGLSETEVDTVMEQGHLQYKFKVGGINPISPFNKNLQIIATTLSGNVVSKSYSAIVTGKKSKEKIFTTMLPQTPSLILHDPPGDGSYAYWEQGQQICKTISMSAATESLNETGLQLFFGPDFEIALTFLGVGENSPIETAYDLGISGTGTISSVNDTTIQTCMTFDQRISTSDDELVVGEQGGDVFVGNGLNLVFGLADVVKIDGMCNAYVDDAVEVTPDRFSTMFIYTEWDIRHSVMRYLDTLAASPNYSQQQRDSFLLSKANWNTILVNDSLQQDKAKTVRNISFSAGPEYEYAISSDTVSVISEDSTGTSTTTSTFDVGATINGLGFNVSLVETHSASTGKNTETGEETGITTGYVLKDNDPGDLFSVDVAMDNIYKTPVFRVKSGQSTCPWEPLTAHREGTSLTQPPNSDNHALHVPANEPAVYKFILGNTSATNELRTYAFTTGPESNPDGAVIKLNGAVLDHPILFAIPRNEPIPVTITLERGPEAYDYGPLELVLYSECEDTRAGILGILPDDDHVVYSPVFLYAQFDRPCSEVNIDAPAQEWVIQPDPNTPGSDDTLTITFSGYDKSVQEFDRIRVQYRQTDGDGTWYNITEILKADLGNVYSNIKWNTTGLSDGPYEIRALALCQGNTAITGYSKVIKGMIDRTPPAIVGVPEPSDGVYQSGDEISVTFDKKIDCGQILPDLMGDQNNVGLYDLTTGTLIEAVISCYENKITLVPTDAFQNATFENHILQVQLHDIADKTGNVLPQFDWDFYVDRNELAWLTDSIGTVKYDDESKVLTANIHNRAGLPVPFTIQNVPSWVRVVPDAGTLVPNEVREIRFEIDSLLAIGDWSDSIFLHTETGQNPFFMGGDEGLPLGVRVVCRPPQWQVNTGLYPNTMNFAVKLNIEGVLSADAEDRVAAYIDNTLHGSAKVQFVPNLNAWMAFLTVYGNPEDADKPIDLEIWDASACLRYGDIVEQYQFQPDNLVGAANNPVILHTSGQVLREIPLAQGWNWISFNLSLPDPAINPVLNTLIHPEDDYIKSQTQFSEYFSNSWLGSLTTLGNLSMYQYRANIPDTLKLIGELIDPTATPISLVAGWNWISYLPNRPLPVNDALASLSPVTGDLIKGQFGFAQYIATYGWIGSLTHLKPPQGYQLHMTNAGTLNYPASNFQPDHAAEARDGGAAAAFWQVNAAQYEYSMTLIGMISANGVNTTQSTQELGAFVGNELRGGGQAVYIEPLNAYLFFLTTYSNQPGEQVHFKLYDSASGQIDELQEMFWFAADLHQGSIESPIPFSLETSGLKDINPDLYLKVQPNPFHESASIWFSNPQAEDVNLLVSDVQGKTILKQKISAATGLNTFKWNADGVAAGVYFIRLETPAGVAVRKIVRE